MVIKNPRVCAGAPTIFGTRLTVYDILDGIVSNGLTDFCNEYELTKLDVIDSLKYCASLDCKNDEIDVFCYGCTLNKEHMAENCGGIENSVGDTFVKYDNGVFIGTIDEYEHSMKKIDGWSVAANLIMDNLEIMDNL